ncbi:hypothetical protein L2737_04000 [Shewanella electrodiphila]|uniref:Uncharacterized protein n=1 Tax=Shewanella electrodiphila TaxID=934143 RepID=A0ABT0KM93_9GAMM|nr:hypothetical protein [Shewanella electrodiphila]MCL1044495.1 hypothetical protein [Shewanella electrodiphila]
MKSNKAKDIHVVVHHIHHHMISFKWFENSRFSVVLIASMQFIEMLISNLPW